METYSTNNILRGGKNSNNISIRYRGIHPSFIGNIDLLVCGNSDPGTSGVLSPFGKIDGLYFNNSEEPNDFIFNFREDVRKLIDDTDAEYLEIKADNREDYNKILNSLVEFNKDAITVNGTSKDKYTIIVENSEGDDEVDEKESDSSIDESGE